MKNDVFFSPEIRIAFALFAYVFYYMNKQSFQNHKYLPGNQQIYLSDSILSMSFLIIYFEINANTVEFSLADL